MFQILVHMSIHNIYNLEYRCMDILSYKPGCIFYSCTLTSIFLSTGRLKFRFGVLDSYKFYAKILRAWWADIITWVDFSPSAPDTGKSFICIHMYLASSYVYIWICQPMCLKYDHTIILYVATSWQPWSQVHMLT